MSNNDEQKIVEMSVTMLEKLMQLNRDAHDAVSAVGGNSVQEGYRNNTFVKLDEQYKLMEVFKP